MQFLVTVGTTRFDTLIASATSNDFLIALYRLGFSKIMLQIGDSPCTLNIGMSIHSSGLVIEIIRFTTRMKQMIDESRVILSHAGAGTILDVLDANTNDASPVLERTLIVCVNETLMDNHQLELALKITELGFCSMTTPATLVSDINRCLGMLHQPSSTKNIFAFNRGVKLSAFLEKCLFFL